MKLIDAAKNRKYGSLIKDNHYFEAYDYHFGIVRNNITKVLEIGILNGGSLSMWEEYFPKAKVVGIDINPDCNKYKSSRNEIYIGDQADIQFLNRLIAIEKNFDIIIDDGGHYPIQQITSLNILFHSLNNNGCYVIEDIGTSYLKAFGGGIKEPSSAIEYLKNFIDYVNIPAQLLETTRGTNYFEQNVSSVHFYNSMVFIFKNAHANSKKSFDWAKL